MTDAVIMTVESLRTRASTNEALLTLAVPLENAALVSGFVAKIGKQVGVAFADIDNHDPGKSNMGRNTNRTKPPKPYGNEAKALKLCGFFRNEKVWRAIGTDEHYRKWVQRQPSAWSGNQDWIDGEGRCEAAHVRRIATGAGMQIKNEYACIPLTHEEHRLQSDKGESVFGSNDVEVPESGRDWMERKRMEHVERWAWESLKKHIGFTSMADIPPLMIHGWADRNGLAHFLPPEYR